jgi:sterol desaturase/sphingolipid hydroxylase (fatty acid hydroxylase superfamily)
MPEVLDWLRQVTPLPIKQFYWAAWPLYSSPWFWAAFAAILVAERLWPVDRRQHLISPALVEDGLWLNVEVATRALLLPVTAAAIATAYRSITGGAVIPWLTQLPMGARIAVSLVLFDFLQYAVHWLIHKVPPFWHFHVIHHSQRQLNLLTASRSHVGEYLIVQVFAIVPMLALQMTPFAIIGTSSAISWFNRLTHANLRWDFGPVGHFLVSPQYHRIHHSFERRHHDRNYGQILTLWDRIFGTMYHEPTEYPATGVTGSGLAPSSSLNPLRAAANLAGQLWYPFRRIAAGGWRSR